MRKIRTLAAAGVAAATLMLGVVTASPASAAQACSHWQDDYTYGAGCSEFDGLKYVQAMAHCANGETVYGSWAVIGSGNLSYAYCSSWGSKLSWGEYRVM
ncbi:hypothetical protein ACFVUN_20540 [Kitasatospora griseola]|uniref:hypothetical protein n=1 Tax=Kitasatospora griseola TaxID=2064 RepID=UPI0036D79044